MRCLEIHDGDLAVSMSVVVVSGLSTTVLVFPQSSEPETGSMGEEAEEVLQEITTYDGPGTGVFRSVIEKFRLEM